MFDERPQNSNVIYASSDEPMSAEEWKKQYVTDFRCGAELRTRSERSGHAANRSDRVTG